MITTVTGKNQITIPAQLARQLEIQPGTRLEWSVSDDGKLHAQIVPHRGVLARKVAGLGRGWLEEGMDPIEDLIHERRQDDVAKGLF